MSPWLFLLAGCQKLCPEWSRLDGFYAVNPVPDTTDLSGQGIDEFLEGDFFAMRWSEWELRYQPASREFRIEIDSQPFNAALTEAADSCSDFGLRMSGVYRAAGGDERYTFELAAELFEVGPKWKGEADIDLDWTHVDGTGGTVRGLSVYLLATEPD